MERVIKLKTCEGWKGFLNFPSRYESGQVSNLVDGLLDILQGGGLNREHKNVKLIKQVKKNIN